MYQLPSNKQNMNKDVSQMFKAKYCLSMCMSFYIFIYQSKSFNLVYQCQFHEGVTVLSEGSILHYFSFQNMMVPSPPQKKKKKKKEEKSDEQQSPMQTNFLFNMVINLSTEN